MNPQTKLCIVTALVSIFVFGEAARAKQTQYPKPTELPDPYRLVEGWPSLPKTMNGGKWGEVIRVHVDEKGNIWVFHRCSTWCRRARQRVSGAALRIRRFWNSIRQANF